MSLRGSPSDITTVVTFCRDLYRRCRSASDEYDEIRREVRGLHTVLKHLKSEIEDENSPLNRDRSLWGNQLAPIIGDCDFTLRQLDGQLLKYGRLLEGNEAWNAGDKASWDCIRFGSNEMDQLGSIRVKLISHKTSLTLFLNTIQLHESGKMAKSLDIQGEQLDVILDKVDYIAAKIVQRAGTLMTSYEDDDKEVWKQFRRELISEGFSSDVLQQHKDVLRAYIRQMEQDGLLIEAPLTPHIHSPVIPHTERWIDSTRSGSSRGQPPSFDSINMGSNENGAKEMIQREDSMKYPTSIKLERFKPESGFDSYSERHATTTRQISPPPTPKISTTDFTEPDCQDTSGSRSASDTSSIHRTSSPSNSSIIQTSDLLLLPFPATPQLLPSPSLLNKHPQSDEARRSMAHRPKSSSDQGLSPRTSGVRFDLPNLQPSPRIGTPVTEASPRSESTVHLKRIAPDSQGKDIPADAKWTKVKRSLISPGVLNQDGRRYEARPEYVAILGILTKEEIQNYASRSHILREERWRRHHQASMGPEPRLRRERTSRTRRIGDSSASDNSSCSSDTTSDTDSDSNEDRQRGKGRTLDGRDRRKDDRDYRREIQGDRGGIEERTERRDRKDGKGRDRELQHTFSPASAPYSQSQSHFFSSSPNPNSNNPSHPPRPWNIPGANQAPQGQGYPPPPPLSFSPRRGYRQQPQYPIQNQQYLQGPPNQYLSPQPYTPYPNQNPNSQYSPSSSPAKHHYQPMPIPDHAPHQHPRSHSHRRRHHHSKSDHSHYSRDHSRDHPRDRDRERERDRDLAYESSKSRDGGSSGGNSVFGKAPTTGSRWRDHLTAAGLGGAAVGLLGVLSEAADGF